jgi:hypothetical protein
MPKIAFPMGRRVQRTGYPQAVQELKLQTQKLLGLSDDVTVSVTELSCREPGCPTVETVVAILGEGEKPTIARIHKPIPNVTPDELKAAFELAFVPKPLAC